MGYTVDSKDILLILQVKETNDKMEELTEMPSIVNRKMELQITKKLLAIMGSFFVLSLLNGIFFLTASHVPIPLLASISDCFTCMNSGVNIFIYGTMDSRYRDAFKSLFCNGCTGETEGSIPTRNIKIVSATTKVTSA